MKVLLIQPPSTIMSNRKESKPALPPLGLAYIAGHLRNNGHGVKIFDCLAERYHFEDINSDGDIEYGALLKCDIKEYNPDFIGISIMMSCRHNSTKNMLKWINEYTNSPIIVGGNHVSSMSEYVDKDFGELVDHIVIGEGEHAMLDIVNGKITDRIVYGKQFDIKNLPMPAHDLLPLDRYKQIWEQSNYHFYEPVKFTIMNTSRGCSNLCEHCPHESVFGKGWRHRSLKDIEDEVIFVKSLGVKEIQFHEYNGFMNPKFMLDVARLMKKHNMQWNVPIGVWLKILTEKYVHELADCGMNCIDLAIESRQNSILNTMKGKDVDNNHALNVIKWCRDAGLYINAFFMIGFPNQTLNDMWDTVFYAKSLDIDSAAIFIAQPLPATILWNKAKFIDGFEPYMLRYGKCNTKSENWTPEQVEHIRHEGRRIFIECKSNKNSIIRGGNFIVKNAN